MEIHDLENICSLMSLKKFHRKSEYFAWTMLENVPVSCFGGQPYFYGQLCQVKKLFHVGDKTEAQWPSVKQG